jgi:hypothetical protein
MGANTPPPKSFSPRGPLGASQGVGVLAGGSSTMGSAAADSLRPKPAPALPPAPVATPASTPTRPRTNALFGPVPSNDPMMKLWGNQQTGDIYKRIRYTNYI